MQAHAERRRLSQRQIDRLLDPPSEEERARRRRAGNLKRRAAMLAYHERNRDPLTGKSGSAQKGGRIAWAKRAAVEGGSRALAVKLAIARWYPEATAARGNGG